MDSEILKDVWPPVPKHIETKVAELEAEVAMLELVNEAGRNHASFLEAERDDFKTGFLNKQAEVAALRQKLVQIKRIAEAEPKDKAILALLEGKQDE